MTWVGRIALALIAASMCGCFQDPATVPGTGTTGEGTDSSTTTDTSTSDDSTGGDVIDLDNGGVGLDELLIDIA